MPEVLKMLFGQNLGGRHKHSLVTGFNRVKHRGRRHYGLACADISLQQSTHRNLFCHILAHLSNRTLLGCRWPVRERIEKAFRQLSGSDVPVSRKRHNQTFPPFHHNLHCHKFRQREDLSRLLLS